ncbi:MAG: DNA gyrase subunit A [Candidatus Palauibacterales bacterium]|nr:DNA gyrase subunit A [Candidatus Palauibacterales bacterium]
MKTTARNERIVTRLIEEELRDSFIDYSMSVIVQRALPDARDGLKPVHRRILYAMYELGLFPEREHKKCATVVGDVLGKYHPHGDSAVYDTLVRMVQEFSLRYPLIDGQGNFGSIDGDSAAAYRYTEAKLASIAMELLTDIDRDTVDFAPNFDGRLQEPTALPARLPHLLLNGSDGIAVGMATKIPPHNMRELAAATDLLVRKPECSVEDLVELIDGPDFPTGGYIWGYEGIGDAYRTGRGLIEMRARMHLEEGMYGKQSLVVTELPYQVNKTRVIEQITKIVRSGRVEAITDLRDESDRDGVRLVIELKRDANLKKLIKTLFLKTQLKSTFGVIMLALVDGRPEQLDLKQALQCFVDHRLDVIRRRAVYELNKSEDRAHVLEGLLTALDQIDRVIELIRASTSPKAAADRLCAEFGLTQRQAEAILAMRLARLTQLERKKLIEELEALRSLIEELRHLVEEDAARRAVLRSELAELALRYGDDRRTEILDESEPFPLPAGESGESSLVMISRLGYAKAQVVRGSGGMSGAEAMAERDGDFVRQTFVARGSTEVLLFTARGSVFSLSVKDLPRGTRSSRGKQLSDFVELSAGDRIVSVVPVPEFDPEKYLLFVTREGQVKRTALSEYTNVRSGGIRATGLADDDEVMMVRPSVGTGDLLLATRSGLAIRFAEDEIRPMGRAARGVRGIDVAGGDALVAALAPRRDADLLVIGAAGYGKRVPFTELKRQGRAGKGMAILPDTDRAGELVGVLAVHPGDHGMCELASGEVVPVAVEPLPVKSRRGASVRLEALGQRAGPVVAVHPLRVSTGDREGEPPEGDDGFEFEPEPEEELDVTGSNGEDLLDGTTEKTPGGTQGEFEL